MDSPTKQEKSFSGGQKNSQKPQNLKDKQPLDKPSNKYTVKKRPPPKSVPQRPNDVYISDRSNFKAQLARCQKLFEGEYSEVFVHGLGSAIPRAINVAVELKKFYQGTVDYSVNTSTIQLIDDLIPVDEVTAPSQQSRKVSCVDIRVFRTVNIP